MSFALSFDWLEGSRLFDVVFGAVTSAACLAIAVPLLFWVLPRYRTRFFLAKVDAHQHIQLGYGLAAMSMAFADALCRFIPHRPLAFTHPAFFLTTVALVLFLGPRTLALAARGSAAGSNLRLAAPALAGALALLVAFPISAVVRAFW